MAEGGKKNASSPCDKRQHQLSTQSHPMSHETREPRLHTDLTNDEELTNHQKRRYHAEPEEREEGL